MHDCYFIWVIDLDKIERIKGVYKITGEQLKQYINLWEKFKKSPYDFWV